MLQEKPGLVAVRQCLKNVPPGDVGDDQLNGIERLLSKAWEALSGGQEEGMQGNKLLRRMSSVSWNPPILTFLIERHGAFVRGSTRVSDQEWEVDLSQATATLLGERKRQKIPAQRPMRMAPIAAELADLILQNANADSRLKRYPDGSVEILMKFVVPADGQFKQTVEGRRKLRNELTMRLAPHGWKRVSRTNKFRRGGSD